MILTPSQYRDINGNRADTPERTLAAAVIEAAALDLNRANLRSTHARRAAREAEIWVLSQDRDWPYSFVNLCELLGLDPAATRDHLLTKAFVPTHNHDHGRIMVRGRKHATHCCVV